jgi:hypothetical protein
MIEGTVACTSGLSKLMPSLFYKRTIWNNRALIKAGFTCMSVVLFAGMLLLLHAGICAAGDTRLDLTSGWRFRPDADNVGFAEGWHTASYSDHDWAVLDAGKRWEDQGFPDVDGYAWYRRRVDVPESWRGEKVWLVIGGANDACEVFCNGELINTYGDDKELSVNSTPIIVDLSRSIHFGQSNVVAVKCYDWGASGGLWRLPCALTTDPARLPVESLVACYPDRENHKLTVEVDLTGLGNERPETTLRAALFRRGSKLVVAKRAVPVASDANDAAVSFEVPDARAGSAYRIEVAAEDPKGKPVAGVVASLDVEWDASPRWPGEYASLKVLNNFVTELLSARVGENGHSPGSETRSGQSVFSFANPRSGWVFFSVSYDRRNVALPAPRAILDDRPEPLVWRPNPDTGAFEAMRFLAIGEHRIQVEAESPGQLDVRTMPEIAFCYYPSSRHITAYPPYDWEYVERYVLPHVNTLITRSEVPQNEFDQWLGEGRQWISNAGLPGLASSEAPAVEDVYEYWASNLGVTQPGFGGMMVDEFLWSGVDHYRAWSDAVSRLNANASFRGKTFYAWCGDLFKQQPSLEFSRLLTELGYRFSWEKYLREEPTADRARRLMLREMQRPFAQWKKVMPGVERHTVMCLGYLCAPPETLNLNPGVDYHVFLDMQFQMLATEPTFWGLYGIMEYMAAYADEESIRWAHRLFRHYCIEGNRTPLTNDPYLLPHVRNPDFADELDEWRVEPAEKGSIDTKVMDGFSWLQGRYPKTAGGDRFCWMKRSAESPNRVRQTIRSLEPGRLYSLKLISADLTELDKKQTLVLAINIDGAELLDEYCFQFPYPSCYSHEVPPYNRTHPAYFNFHRVVFRPTGRTAELVISDWAASTDPGGPFGQEIAFNFVEVQPFLEP